jgi:hypothetical protein
MRRSIYYRERRLNPALFKKDGTPKARKALQADPAADRS